MPIPRNWVEELAIEWLTIGGYLTESNVRLKAEKRGGIPEADVIGAKLEHECLDVVHVETGSLAQGFEKNLRWVRKKFEHARREAIEAIFRETIEWAGDVSYRPIFIASYASRPDDMKSKLEEDKIHFWMFEEFVEKEVFKSIDEWKNKQVEAGRRKTQKPTLPECYWLLNLLDSLRTKKLLRPINPC